LIYCCQSESVIQSFAQFTHNVNDCTLCDKQNAHTMPHFRIPFFWDMKLRQWVIRFDYPLTEYSATPLRKPLTSKCIISCPVCLHVSGITLTVTLFL